MEDNVNKVIELLNNYNWIADGFTSIGIMRIYGKDVIYGNKMRYKSLSGKWKVSIGKRITYFYSLDDKRYFDTKNIDIIREFLDNVKEE